MVSGVALAIVAAAGLALSEVTGRGLAAVVEEPLWWHDLFTQRKEAQMHALRRHGGVDVVAIGTSTILLGLDPDVVARSSGVRCYNASIYRGVPTVTEAWLHDVVLPTLRPSVVLMGISPAEINDNSVLTTRLREYQAARIFNVGRRLAAYRRLSRTSYAVRYAPMVKRPRALGRAILTVARRPRTWSWHPPPEIPGVLGPAGQGLDFLDRDYFNTPRMRELCEGMTQNFSGDGVQAAAVRRIVRLNASFGAKTIFVGVPATDEFVDTFVGGRKAWLEGWQCVRELIAETGAPLVDVSAEIKDHGYYADMLHLNRYGRDTFSARLASALGVHLTVAPGVEPASTREVLP